jgi:hypothetical protein
VTVPPRTSRPAARTTSVPAGVPATGDPDAAPLAGKTPQIHSAAQAKTQVTASREPAQLKYVVLAHEGSDDPWSILAVSDIWQIREYEPTEFLTGKARQPIERIFVIVRGRCPRRLKDHTHGGRCCRWAWSSFPGR